MVDEMRKKRRNVIAAVVMGVLMIPVIVYLALPETAFRILVAAERGIAGLERRSIEIDGVGIAYLEGGQDENLLLLHGFGANKDNWTRVGKYLTPHFHVIAPDLPGFGESTADPKGDYSMDAQVRRIHAFVRKLDIKRFHLGGNSMGGYIAALYASRYPADVASLWLLAPGGVMAAEPSDMQRMLEEGRGTPLVVKNPEDFERLMGFVFVKPPFIPGVVKEHLAREAVEHSASNERIFKHLHSDFSSAPLEGLLQHSATPTLVLWGSGDRVLDVSGADILESMLTHGRVVVMDNVGHIPMIEKPQETANIYLTFSGVR
jgi:pimeloyl-ACP methyl ester carboxylesterase